MYTKYIRTYSYVCIICDKLNSITKTLEQWGYPIIWIVLLEQSNVNEFVH